MTLFSEVEFLPCDLFSVVLSVIGNRSNPSFTIYTLEDFRKAVMMSFNSIFKYVCIQIKHVFTYITFLPSRFFCFLTHSPCDGILK
jgi:hypothetical protein